MQHIKSSLGLAACLVLQACTAPAPAPSKKIDPAGVAIDQSLEIKENGKPIGPETVVPAPVFGPNSTSVSFLGDASTLLANAAHKRGDGWKFEVTGPHPRLPIYVQVNVKNVTFVAFLKDVAEQLGQRADIEVVGGKNIRLRYRAHD